MAQSWQVVGGKENGGILVREGQSIKSAALSDRLSTGATVEELLLAGDRLRFKLLSGAGPTTGWISVAASGKALAERVTANGADADGTGGAEPGKAKPEADDGSGGGACSSSAAAAASRCKAERSREVAAWQGIGMEVLMENCDKEMPGMRYGIKFPHTPELLKSAKYGAQWLTKAFHAAGTLAKDNSVKRIVGTKPLSGGGACLKAMVEVEYARPCAELHTKLFMKYPYDFNDKTQKTDRMNSSVIQQTMDIAEVDAYRLLESELPFPMPKFYFGDVSNETTNFVLITELVNFGDGTKSLEAFAPFEVEPAYDKFLDFEQFKPYEAVEYYRLMTESNAKMAAWYKAGKLGEPEWLGKFFLDGSKGAPGGLPEAEFKRKLLMGEEFLTTTARQLFPPELLTDAHVKEWKRVLCAVNGYKDTIYYAAGADDDYCALMHGNMNPDNTWYWRDTDKKLQIGVLDWGGLSKVAFGPKIWWSFYAAEIDMFEGHLDDLLESFASTYKAEGGPEIDTANLRRDFMLAALDQAVGILGAIPLIYRVIPKKQWETVADRHDSRLRGSFLTRMYVQGFVLIFTMLHRFNLGKVVDDFLALPGVPKRTLPNV